MICIKTSVEVPILLINALSVSEGSVIVHVVPLSLPSAITDLSAFNSLTAVMSFVVLLVLVMVTV